MGFQNFRGKNHEKSSIRITNSKNCHSCSEDSIYIEQIWLGKKIFDEYEVVGSLLYFLEIHC